MSLRGSSAVLVSAIAAAAGAGSASRDGAAARGPVLQEEHARFLRRCGPWCAEYVALHNNITRRPARPEGGYLEIDCDTSPCGGFGNIVQAVGSWSFLAYLTGRAAVVRLAPSMRVHDWAGSPFFRSAAPLEPVRPENASTQLLAAYTAAPESLHPRRVAAQLATADLDALLTRPRVVVRPDTTAIVPSLLRNPRVQAKLRRDGFPLWLGRGVGMENMRGAAKHNDSIVDLFAYLHFQPTRRLHAMLAPHLRALGFPERPYLACHVRDGDRQMVNSSSARPISYPPLNWTCLGDRVGARPFFFTADTAGAVARARQGFGAQVVTTDGVPTHLHNHHVRAHPDAVALDPSVEDASKTFLDFFLLAYSGLPVIRNTKASSFSQQAGGWGRMRVAVERGAPERLETPATQCCSAGRCWAH